MIHELLINILQDAVLLFILILAWKLLGRTDRPAAVMFFMLGTISLLLDDCYWIAYDLIRPETRMPFAANEIGEMAIFLLLAATLTTLIPRAGAIYIKERVLSVAFVAASVALWIGWSGEWLQDIIGGIAFGYLFCVTVRVMKQTGALTPAWWRGIWTGLALLVFLEAMTFFVPQRIRGIFELAGYILMAATMVLLLLKAVILAAKKTEPRQQVAISFAGFVWSMSCMYMSSGGWYLSAMIIGTLALPLMLYALKKEVAV